MLRQVCRDVCALEPDLLEKAELREGLPQTSAPARASPTAEAQQELTRNGTFDVCNTKHKQVVGAGGERW